FNSTNSDILTDGIRGSAVDTLLPTADKKVRATARMLSMVRHFQKMGHFCAKTDPLDLPMTVPFITSSREKAMKHVAAKDFIGFGLSEDDYNRPVSICLPATGGIVGTWHIHRQDRHPEWEGRFTATLPKNELRDKSWTCGEIYERLKDVYCGSIGLEYLHIHDRDKINWL